MRSSVRTHCATADAAADGDGGGGEGGGGAKNPRAIIRAVYAALSFEGDALSRSGARR
jgi:hypothetical protein